MSEEIRKAVALAAESYEGTRFRHRGRKPGAALDCGGVVVCAGRAAGLEVYDVLDYERAPDPPRFMEAVRRNFDPITRAEAGPGDVEVYWFKDRETPQHFAVLIERRGKLHAVHAFAEVRKVVVCARSAPDLAPHFHSAWRFRGAV